MAGLDPAIHGLGRPRKTWMPATSAGMTKSIGFEFSDWIEHMPEPQTPSLAQLISLKGRRALITGGARGIGLAIARRFAEAGASVLLGDQNAAGARDAAISIADTYGTPAHAALLDVTRSASVAAFADEGMRLFGGIDIWVNNAGVYPGKALVETDDELWERVNGVNLGGTFFGCREAGRRMIDGSERPGRVIVNIASVSAVRGRAGLTHYSAAKSGVLGVTRGAAVEFAPHGIRVLCVIPALADTPGSQEMRAAAQKPGTSAEMIKDMERRILAAFPLGRIGQADEVARVVLFCASDMAAFMTGSSVFVDGGLTTT
jgi:NAD(P)-dependent dehydrogenase (short-subunit alcohol dehydrogenase family)